MSKTVLFVDGENFRKKVQEVFRDVFHTTSVNNWSEYNIAGLFRRVLFGMPLDERRFYSAKIRFHPETKEKSLTLIDQQRKLKNALEREGFRYIISGRVVGQRDGKGGLVFREKGVDVQIAVDLVIGACDGSLEQAVIVSSDSDLQPAIKQLKPRGVGTVYVGFENKPNKGLSYTTDRTILIRNSEVEEFLS